MISQLLLLLSVLIGSSILPAGVFAQAALPVVLTNPPDDSTNKILITSQFQWSPYANAVKYSMDVTPFIQSVDNITGVCGSGTCSIPLTGLGPGHPITFNGSHNWKITAIDVNDNPIAVSGWRSFVVEDPPCPAPCGGPPVSPGNTGVPVELENPISADSIGQLFNLILTFITTVAVLVLPLVVIYAGYILVSGKGDPQKVIEARTMLMWAAIAFILILLARGIPLILRNLL